jgi:DNA polymerase-3 subunit gamma/tau
VRAGGGSARDTLSILDQLLAGSDETGIRYDRAVALLGYTDASLLDEIMDAFAARDGAAVFRTVNRVIEGGHEPRRFATDMLDRFRDLIVLGSVPDAIDTGLLDVPPDRAEALAGQAKRFGLASLTRAADLVAVGLDQMRGATSPRLLLELMCAQVLLPAAAADERSLLARLERLESGAVAVTASAPAAPRQETNDHPERSRVSPQPHPSPEGGPAPDPGQAAGHQQPGQRPAAQPGGHSEGGAQRPAPVPPGSSTPQRPAPVPPGSSTPQRPAPVPPGPAAPQRPAPAFTHAAGTPAAAAPRATVTVDVLRQAWPNVIEAIKAKGRVASLVIGNASVASFDEGVLTLRFPRQGDVKGFQGSRYEDLLKQALAAMFGINVVIRAVTGGGDAPSPGRRPGPGPAPAAPSGQSPFGQAAPSSHGQPQPGAASPDFPQPPASPSAQAYQPEAGGAPGTAGPAARAAGNGGSAGVNPFGGPGLSGGDLPPLPPPPDDDEDFDPDDEDMSSSTTVNDLTGMALIQRELGAQIIAEYDD